MLKSIVKYLLFDENDTMADRFVTVNSFVLKNQIEIYRETLVRTFKMIYVKLHVLRTNVITRLYMG